MPRSTDNSVRVNTPSTTFTTPSGRRFARHTTDRFRFDLANLMDHDDRGLESTKSEDFAEFSEAVRRELSPTGVIESTVADLVARAVWDLTRSKDARPGAGQRAAKELVQALAAFDRLQDRRQASWGRPSPAARSGVATPEPDTGPNIDPKRATRVAPYHVEGIGIDDDATVGGLTGGDEEGLFPSAGSDFAAPEADGSQFDGAWRARLEFDLEVSDASPVVRGTWITASHVVSLVVDGWSWADILRAHPEIIEDDIRACLAYTIEQEDGGFSL